MLRRFGNSAFLFRPSPMTYYVHYSIRSFPGGRYEGITESVSVEAWIRADGADQAQVIAEGQIRKDGWEITTLMAVRPADPKGHGASVAEKQGWLFHYDLTKVPGSLLKELGIIDDDDDED